MWIATWALNTLVAKGKSTDWMVHGSIYSLRHGKRFGFKAERAPGFRKKSEIMIREAVE